jgi:MIT (microtubule interacting and transport) domain
MRSIASTSVGQLSDHDIALLGALPGSTPEALLNSNGTPLNSKNILTIALQKAQNAVMLDGANNVPDAIAAYRQAVRLLQEVMERIAPKPGKKMRSNREEERRRLKVIVSALLAAFLLNTSLNAALHSMTPTRIESACSL